MLRTPSGTALQGVLRTDAQALNGAERRKTNEVISAQLCPLPGLMVGQLPFCMAGAHG